MTKRILLSFLLAWLAIAPAIASSCAAGCETMSAPSAHHSVDEHADAGQSDVPDCHERTAEHDDSKVPDSGSMTIACLVANAASLPSFAISVEKLDLDSEQHAFVLLPPLSFETSPPNKPPQA